MQADFQVEAYFESILFEVFGQELKLASFQALGGGCINNAVKLVLQNNEVFFLKYNFQCPKGLFEAEHKGLSLLQQTKVIKIPKVIASHENYLLLEYIDSMPPSLNYWEDFAHDLTKMHQMGQEYFGLNHNNFIGSLPQNNEYISDGIDFLIEKRFRVQASKAMYDGLIDTNLYQKFQLFYDKLPSLIPNEKPALLHGDLWSANVMVGENGEAVLVDPAVYYGFREMELAFTKMFGGFEQQFYDTYQEIFPFEKGFEDRVAIYNLYPLLVHLNLFGTSYLSAIKRLIERYTS